MLHLMIALAMAQDLAHTHEVFHFTARAPIESVFPLFGADKERLWAPDWKPAFVWPAPTEDRQGMVFKVAHGDRSAIWVNTVLDSSANKVQYVYVIPDVVVTVITLSLKSDAASTDVAVTYDRTALTPDANELVNTMASHDRKAGPEWGQQINSYLKTKP